MDPVKILPTEAFEKVLSFLNLKELMTCCVVSQKWNIAANNDALWKELCFRNAWYDCGKLKEYVNYFKFLSPDKRDAFDSMGDWKKHFVLRTQLQNNWREGKLIDYTLYPVDQIADDNVTCATSDGHNIVVFGFDNGTVKLFDLKQDGQLMVKRDCAFTTPIHQVRIFQNYLFILQKHLLQIFKIKFGSLEPYCTKSIARSSVTNIGVISSTLPDRIARTSCVYETGQDDNVVFYLDDNYLILGTEFSNTLTIYSLKSDLLEHDNTVDLDISSSKNIISTIYAENDKLFTVIGEYETDHLEEQKTLILSVRAYSLKTKAQLFSENLVTITHPMDSSHMCTIESNRCYLLVKFRFNYFCLLQKLTGRLLLDETGIIFLDANSNASLVALTLDDTFQITDPNTGGEYFCLTLDGSPVAFYSSIVITQCVEYDSDGDGSTEIEFWNLHNDVQKVYDLKFPKIPSVSLVYNDNMRLIFYSKEYCIVRSFLV